MEIMCMTYIEIIDVVNQWFIDVVEDSNSFWNVRPHTDCSNCLKGSGGQVAPAHKFAHLKWGSDEREVWVGLPVPTATNSSFDHILFESSRE